MDKAVNSDVNKRSQQKIKCTEKKRRTHIHTSTKRNEEIESNMAHNTWWILSLLIFASFNLQIEYVRFAIVRFHINFMCTYHAFDTHVVFSGSGRESKREQDMR